MRDIDSARGMLHVRHGKGGKDRYVPLPERTLEMLRDYWNSPARMLNIRERALYRVAMSCGTLYILGFIVSSRSPLNPALNRA